MARLNTQTEPSQSIENLRKRFATQNRAIAKAHSALQERVNQLESHIQELTEENFSLRQENIRLVKERTDNLIGQHANVRALLKDKWQEIDNIICSGFEIPQENGQLLVWTGGANNEEDQDNDAFTRRITFRKKSEALIQNDYCIPEETEDDLKDGGRVAEELEELTESNQIVEPSQPRLESQLKQSQENLQRSTNKLNMNNNKEDDVKVTEEISLLTSDLPLSAVPAPSPPQVKNRKTNSRTKKSTTQKTTPEESEPNSSTSSSPKRGRKISRKPQAINSKSNNQPIPEVIPAPIEPIVASALTDTPISHNDLDVSSLKTPASPLRSLQSPKTKTEPPRSRSSKRNPLADVQTNKKIPPMQEEIMPKMSPVRRRSRGATQVNYALPSLRTKMRRENDKFVAAVVVDQENDLPEGFNGKRSLSPEVIGVDNNAFSTIKRRKSVR